MRICFISFSVYGYFDQRYYADAAGGGAQRQLSLLAREFAPDHDVHFVVGDYGQGLTEVLEGITFQRSFRPIGSKLKKPLEMLRLFRAMRRADADVYVSRNKPSVAVASYVGSRVLGKPWIFNVSSDKYVQSDLSYISPPLRVAYRHALRDADGIIAQTEEQRRNLIDHYSVESTVVPNGYPKLEDCPTYGQREYVLWVGRLDEDVKRPSLFLELAERLSDVDFQLVGAGGSDRFRSDLEAEVAALDNVECKFDVPPDRIHRYFERSFALVNTSTHEGFSNTFLEAWRAGTPVIGFDVDPDRHLDQGDLGDFAAGDPSLLAELVRELLSNPKVWNRHSKQVRTAFEREYGIDGVADRYADALEEAVR